VAGSWPGVAWAGGRVGGGGPRLGGGGGRRGRLGGGALECAAEARPACGERGGPPLFGRRGRTDGEEQAVEGQVGELVGLQVADLDTAEQVLAVGVPGRVRGPGAGGGHVSGGAPCQTKRLRPRARHGPSAAACCFSSCPPAHPTLTPPKAHPLVAVGLLHHAVPQHRDLGVVQRALLHHLQARGGRAGRQRGSFSSADGGGAGGAGRAPHGPCTRRARTLLARKESRRWMM
jgi:hypothetical protein